MIPHVQSASVAEEIVQKCLYFPIGQRGLSPYTRLHEFTHENIDKSLQDANENLMIGILVEGAEGLKNLKEIVEVPHIDLIYLGLFDICQSLGLPGQISHPKVIDEIIRCNEIIRSKKIAAGAMSTSIDYAKFLLENKFNFIAYLNDAAAIRSHFKSFLGELNASY